MLARLYVLLPYIITVPEREPFTIYETVDGEYKVRCLPPMRDPTMIHGRRPEELKLNGKAAFEANVMRIDFCKEDFDRKATAPIDPPEDVIRRAVREFHARLRFVTRAAHAHPVSFPWCQWRIEYTNDDGSVLEACEGHIRGRGVLQSKWSVIGLTREMWDNMFDIPEDFEVPAWDGLRLDAQAALPNVGTAVVLAATSLEVFISDLLDRLAARKHLDPKLWEWIKGRGKKVHLQPAVEEQFDSLLKCLTQHSLKEEPALWEAFKNLKSARNSFVHEGQARVGDTVLTKESAAALVARVNDIVATVRPWLPEEMRWPVPHSEVHVSFKQMLIEPSSEGDTGDA